jgi:hypothetical protein
MWRIGAVTDQDLNNKQLEVAAILQHIAIVPLDARVLKLAAQPFPTVINTLDSLHLAAAIVYREKRPTDNLPVVLATHDHQLANAARAMNFTVLGA